MTIPKLLNLLLTFLSLTSILSILLLLHFPPPTPFAWALLTASLTSLTSSILSFFPKHLFIPHIAFLIFSTFAEAFIFLSLLLYPDTSSLLLDTKNQLVLVRIEMGVMLIMFATSSVLLVLECMVVDHEEVEVRKKRIARVEVVEVAAETELVKEIVEVEMDAFGKKNIEIEQV